MAENQEKITKSEVALREEETLKFWQENDIFKKSLGKGATKGEFVFYEGPPTANGRPGIHHLESRAFKDSIPRYRTMRGYHVRRKAGWDTHGLPVELGVEKEIGAKSKKDIEAFGIAEFNKKCKESVLQYIDEWKAFTDRIAFWVDHDSTYFTFDNTYIESVWSILKVAHERKLLYKDYKILPWCPRCGTGLSSHEVAQGYKDVKDIAVTVKFEAADTPGTYFLAWTTTPWTLPGNVALAVGAEITYVKVTNESGSYILAKEAYEKTKEAFHPTQAVVEMKGHELVGASYKPLFDYYVKDEKLKNRENGWKVYAADFVTSDSGTGIAHEAPAFGADDWELSKKFNLPFVQHVNPDGTMKSEVTAFAGMDVKPKSDDDKTRLGTDIEVLRYLQENNLFFSKENITHSYPHCWRCNTPLLYYATSSWYIAVTKIKDDLIRENEEIFWEPEHIKKGRFGEWLRELKDWAISRSRYWGTPLPIWECGECKHFDVIGSIAQLKEKAGSAPNDLHRPYVDDLSYPCTKCDNTMKRVPEVLDVWFDSGAMPFAQDHYPFATKDVLYPADFISEAIDQTRGWFYTLHAVGGIMGRGKAYKNVVCLGHILDANGKKMSKSVGNIVEPNSMINKYGVDALRYFMFTVSAPGDSKNFDERIVDEIVKKNFGRLGNVLAFWKLYDDGTPRDWKSANVLDRWILARLDQLIVEVTAGFEKYQLDSATRPIAGFIDDLSVWYLRRSRDRFSAKGGSASGGKDTEALLKDKHNALATMRYVLHRLALVMAPTMPFFAEYLFQAVREGEDEESVHLAQWPDASATPNFIERMLGRGSENEKLIAAMKVARDIVTQALEAREKAGIKVRQPLSTLTINVEVPQELRPVIADEVNVKSIVIGTTVALDTTITEELKEEGFVRELIREIQSARKETGLHPQDLAVVTLGGDTEARRLIEKYDSKIRLTVNAKDIVLEGAGEGGKSVAGFRISISLTTVY